VESMSDRDLNYREVQWGPGGREQRARVVHGPLPVLRRRAAVAQRAGDDGGSTSGSTAGKGTP